MSDPMSDKGKNVVVFKCINCQRRRSPLELYPWKAPLGRKTGWCDSCNAKLEREKLQ